MAVSDLNASQLAELVRLVKEKESLQSRLEKIDRSIEAALGNGAAAKPIPAARGRKPRKKGGRQEAILGALADGKKSGGLSAREIADRAGLQLASVSNWLYTKGKTVAGLRLAARGRFVYRGA